jgi:FtsP/CotA-like multicopper oxidase with cupredoxin domain
LKEPLTLSSEHGVLDLLMIARSGSINTVPDSPEGWVYEICKRPAKAASACPQNGDAPNYYGGTLLKLQPGDTLRIHLVNRLPLALNAKHAAEPGHEFLKLNPTNLHTHGMLVSPNGPTAQNPTYGDNVFVLTFNSANGKPQASPHMHSDIRYDFTDYEIKIPKSHPSGLYWFHPHAHGLALNQISSGLSGLITVGDVSDYVCKNPVCAQFLPEIETRHLLLKDTQVLAGGTLQDQENPAFCNPSPAKGEPARQGSCQQDLQGNGNAGTPGRWYFTLNGQVHPTVPIKSRGGEIWRLTNSSGSVTYDLSLWNPAFQRNMLFQVLSVDGVSIQPTLGMTQAQMNQISGGKFQPEACPGVTAADTLLLGVEPLCTRRLHMMPSSRVEVWVTYRDARDVQAAPSQGSYAVFRTNGYQTGDSGDSWPTVNLARVEFQGGPLHPAMPKVLSVDGQAGAMLMPTALAANLAQQNTAVKPDLSCKPLPPGHMRPIFYAVPTDDMNAFGLAYEEIDEHGNVVGTPATDVTPFNPMYPTVCVPLGPGNSPAVERWQLVNVATEDHNFHIHQVKFRSLTKDEVGGTEAPKGVMLDNLPLRAAKGKCGNNPPDDPSNPIADWRAGLCKAEPVVVEIPFTVAGDFVYHCHIMEHEDGGMMARIRVRPTN